MPSSTVTGAAGGLRPDDVDLARDRVLVERYQAGDVSAFEVLYRRYAGRLYRFCLRRVGDPHEAEEVVQEAFARAYRKLGSLAGERRFYPWLSVIAARLCVDARRRRARTELAAAVDAAAGAEYSSEDRVLHEVDVQLLGEALHRLSPAQREVLVLREGRGWSNRRLASHLGVSLGTAEARLFRARRALRREFEAVASPGLGATAPVLAWLWRRIHGLRNRAAEISLAAWAPAVGRAIAVTVLAGSVAAVAGAGGPEETARPAPPPPAARLVARAAVEVEPAPVAAGPASTGAVEAVAPAVHTVLNGRLLTAGDARRKSASAPVQTNAGPVHAAANHDAIVRDTLEALARYGEQIRDRVPR